MLSEAFIEPSRNIVASMCFPYILGEDGIAEFIFVAVVKEYSHVPKISIRDRYCMQCCLYL